MVVRIIDAMTGGVSRTFARNGLLLVAVFAVLGLLNGLLTGAARPSGGVLPEPGLLVLAAGVLSIGLGLAWLGAIVVALRTFVSAETETIPREFVRHNTGWAVLNALVGGIVFGLLVAGGTLLFVVPGIFLLVSCYYWSVFVAVEDQNAIAALRSSWRLTRGSRISLLGLGFAVVILGAAVTGTFALPAAVAGGVLTMAISQIGASVTLVFTLATTARAYDQLAGGEPVVDSDSRPGPAGTPA